MASSFWPRCVTTPVIYFVEFLFVFLLDEILPAFGGENDLDVNLGVSVAHLRAIVALREGRAMQNG